MQTIIEISPTPLHIWVANKLVFQLTSLALGQYADFHFELRGDSGLITQGTLRMEGDDYQGWNNDTPYIQTWILNKLKIESK